MLSSKRSGQGIHVRHIAGRVLQVCVTLGLLDWFINDYNSIIITYMASKHDKLLMMDGVTIANCAGIANHGVTRLTVQASPTTVL